MAAISALFYPHPNPSPVAGEGLSFGAIGMG